jgi:imidazolonepropionase-like amidohydrolase
MDPRVSMDLAALALGPGTSVVGLVVDRVISCHNGTSPADAIRTGGAQADGQDDKVTVLVDIRTGLITGIRDGIYEGENIKLLRFPGCTLLPGFIDTHVHLSIMTDDYQMDHLRLSSAEKSLRCLKAAQGLLYAGFTTVRSAGDADAFFPSFAAAKSFNKHDFLGPTIVGAGHYISVTGGGGDINHLSPDNCSCCQVDGVIADGRDEMVAAVRKEIKYGSDWVKILVTGAFMSASTHAKDSPENTHFSREELAAVVEGS